MTIFESVTWGHGPLWRAGHQRVGI